MTKSGFVQNCRRILIQTPGLPKRILRPVHPIVCWVSRLKRKADFTIKGKAPTRAFSWLKAPTSAFTFKTLLRHYANHPLMNFALASQFHVYLPCLKYESACRRFQPGEGPTRGLLCDCENRLWNRWIVLQHQLPAILVSCYLIIY